MAHTYYILDGAAQAEGKSVSTNTLGSHTLEFWSVDVAGNVEAHKSAAFTVTSPPPPPPDTVAPVTTSNAKATYVSSAAIALSATDAGSGVAHTYYILDGAAQAEGKNITTNVLGSHTLEFWSEDTSGNVEAHKNATFAVTSPPPAPAVVNASHYNLHVAFRGRSLAWVTVLLVNRTTNHRYVSATNRYGWVGIKGLPYGTYDAYVLLGRRVLLRTTLGVGHTLQTDHITVGTRALPLD